MKTRLNYSLRFVVSLGCSVMVNCVTPIELRAHGICTPEFPPPPFCTSGNGGGSSGNGASSPGGLLCLECIGGNGGNGGGSGGSDLCCSEDGSPPGTTPPTTPPIPGQSPPYVPPIQPGVGMATWGVKEPTITLWLLDEPLGYQPAKGQRVSVQMKYAHNWIWNNTYFNWEYYTDGHLLNLPNVFGFGTNWFSSWKSFIQAPPTAEDDYLPLYPSYSRVKVFVGGGGQVRFFDSVSDDDAYSNYNPETRTTLLRQTNGSGTTLSFELSYANGAKDIYGEIRSAEDLGVDWPLAFLTAKIDPAGRTNSFYYEAGLPTSIVRLKYVVDPDGKTNTLSYTNATYTNHVTQITDPYGRSAHFLYDSTGMLTNITDVATLHSAFTYDPTDGRNWLTNLVTPYGTTSFKITEDEHDEGQGELRSGNYVNRAIEVTSPNNAKQLYLYREESSKLFPGSGDTLLTGSYSDVPNTTNGSIFSFTNTFDNTLMTNRNSFYWGPLQHSRLSANYLQTGTLTNLTLTDYKLARLRHWLKDKYEEDSPDHAYLSFILSMERGPSPDGGTEGQKIWYDHAGKPSPDTQPNPLPEGATNGLQLLPLFEAWVLPDGTTRFNRSQYNSFGHLTNRISTYTRGDGTVGVRTNNFFFDSSNGIDLIKHVSPDGTQVLSNRFNARHQVVTNLNALNEATIYTYNATQQLTSIKTPAGLTITNIYNSDGHLEKTIDIEINRTNSYTYANGLVTAHTDERGLSMTNTWDNLQRLVSTTYPDGTYISNRYTYLDLTATKDRLGYWTYFTYNSARQRTAVTNELTKVTIYDYCTCGALNSVTDPLGNVTSFYYDNMGRTTNIIYPGTNSIINRYNLVGQLTNTTDSAGVSVTNWYNHQGLMVASSNALGRVSAVFYDIDDRATNTVGANGISITSTFDVLGRVRTHTYPDGGVEKFGYSVKGLSAYTNQLSKVTKYGYDQAQRKTAATNANNEVTQFKYDASGNLTNLIDGRTNSTFWKYDLYGRLTNKVNHLGTNAFFYSYDANGRLTNRISAAKSNTFYSYDAVGNLTAIDYTNSTDITFSYDANNRLTNMVDAAGTSRYSYSAFGALLSEDGPWDNDTVSYSTDNGRRRSGVSLLQPNSAAWSQSYGYDSANRLTNVTSPAGAFTYAYDSTRKTQISKLTLPNGAFITNTFDSMAQLTGTYLKNSGGTDLNLHAYEYNVGQQRTQQTRTDESTLDYSYDNIGQLSNVSPYGFGSDPGVTFYQNPGVSTSPWWVKLTRVGDVFTAYQSEDGDEWTVIGSVTIEMTNSVYVGLAVTSHDDGVLNLSTFDNVSFLSGWTNADIGSPSEAGSAWYASGTYSIYGGGWDIYDTTDAFHYVYVPLSGNGEFVARVVSVEETDDWAKGGIMIRDGLGASARNAMVELSPGTGVTFQWRTGVSLRVHEHLMYTYDKASNLTKREKNQFTQNFTINQLNQLTNGTRSGTLAVAGTTSSPATNVTVNGLAASRFDDNTFFRAGFTVTNGNNVFTAIAKDNYGRVDTNTVTAYLPATNIYSYDLNGNLLTNGTQMLEYDDENQLIRVTMTNTWKSEFTYDGKMRRRIRKEYLWQNSAWVQTNEVRYVYDGNLVIQERDANNLPTVSYTRGRDLSGSLEGAGGIGGLLARTDHSTLSFGSPSTASAHAYYHADGNGNITALINTNQIIVAKYLYDSFGNILSMSGPLAEANLYRFSSKELHLASGLVYYLYRFYDPNLQRWPNRDPLEEEGGLNLYAFVRNNPISGKDAWGLDIGPSPDPRDDPLYKFGVCLGIAKRRLDEYRDLAKKGRLRPNADKWFHCVISCEMTRQCGASIARAIANTHEFLNPGGGADTRMDQYANQDGRDCGDCKEKKSCEQCCGDKGYSQ